MTQPVTYYFDKERTKKVPVNELGEPIIDWGETIPGQRKEKTLYIENITKDRLILRQPQTNDEDLKILDYPVNLMGKESGTVRLEFAPHVDRLEKHSGIWGFDIVIG